jgi:hypothetical protein
VSVWDKSCRDHYDSFGHDRGAGKAVELRWGKELLRKRSHVLWTRQQTRHSSLLEDFISSIVTDRHAISTLRKMSGLLNDSPTICPCQRCTSALFTYLWAVYLFAQIEQHQQTQSVSMAVTLAIARYFASDIL